MGKILNIKFILIIILSAILVLIAFTLAGKTNTASKEYLVVLNEEGFSPENLTIRKGDVVKFSTIAKNPFWPTSDLHPTHELYPEFDPTQPISFDKNWSFKFEKAGIWKFHNHLAPSQRGTIKVEP